MKLAKAKALAKKAVKAALADYTDMSPEAVEIMQHFGPDAPVVLNTYACAIEDALIKAQGDLQAMREEFSLTYDAVPDEESD